MFERELAATAAVPRPLPFSYGRAAPALKACQGQPGNVPAAQKALFHRAHCNSAARFGRHTPEMERLARAA